MENCADIKKIDFGKMNNMVPTVVQDEHGRVISLVYTSKESLAKTLETGLVWKQSRARGKACMKGATSGNTQELLAVRTDCDNDALLFTIRQKGSGGCHTGSYSCFGTEKGFTLKELFDKIESRKAGAQEGSYTAKLFADEKLLKRKLLEEAAELSLAETKEEVIWEATDLIYFAFAYMAKKKVTIEDIEKENKRRDCGNGKREG